MSSLNGRKVKLFRLHAPYHLVGVGQVGPGAVTNTSIAQTPLNLTYVDGGVEITGKAKGVPFTSYVPGGNIIGMDLEQTPIFKAEK